jgi:hypothetical protein
MSQKKGILRYTPAKTLKLTDVFFVLLKTDATEVLKWLSISVMDVGKY